MQDLIEGYLRFLLAERNLSPYTLRNYRSDLSEFARYLSEIEKDPNWMECVENTLVAEFGDVGVRLDLGVEKVSECGL